MKKVIVAGTGLAGLTTAALLAKRGLRVELFERSAIVGGRSHTISKDGFTMSYGAHAVLAPKSDLMKLIVQELGLKMEYKKLNLLKFKLLASGKVVSSPLGTGLLTSSAVPGMSNRLQCLKLFLKMMKTKPNYCTDYTVQQWITDHTDQPSVVKLLSAFARLYVYDGAIDRFSMNRFAELTNAEFETNEALSYMGYDVLLQQLQQAIVRNGGKIRLGMEVSRLLVEKGSINGIQNRDEVHHADIVVLNLPPAALGKLLEREAKEEFGPYLSQPAHYAYTYDIQLSTQLRRDITNLLDIDNRVYLNVYSLNNPSSVPNGAGMIQAMRFLTAAEQESDDHAETSRLIVEDVLDRVYPNWRANVVRKRIIKRAMVNGIARRIDSKLVPLRSESTSGLYFVGDSTQGRGALGYPCYDSACTVADMLTNH